MVPVSYFEVVSRKDTIATVPINSAAALAAASNKSGGPNSAANSDSVLASSNRSSSTSTSSTNKRFTGGSASTNATTATGPSQRHSNASAASTTNTAVAHPAPSSLASNSSASTPNANSNQPSIAAMAARFSQKQGHSQLYGVVMYDFDAERSDELSAAAGESIIIIAKSNDEWFVAKPIGRLGGPGLIPISFIEVRDIGSNKPVENVEEAIRKANIPKVEEWKRMAAEYKASSIPLGKLEDTPTSRLRSRQLSSDSVPLGQDQHSHFQQHPQAHYTQPQMSHPSLQPLQIPPQQNLHQQPQQSPVTAQSSHSLQHASIHSSSSIPPVNDGDAYVLSACVDRYAFADDRYWYLVVAKLSNGRYRHLCRYYQDFYDFQVNLLDEFPNEAGRTGNVRSLPFMPGPLTYVNDSISSQRRVNLDEYVKKLVSLPPYISRSPIVQKLFAVRTGDIESTSPNSVIPQPPTSIHRSTPEVHEQPPPSTSNTIVSASGSYQHAEGQSPVTSPTATLSTVTAPDGHLAAPDTHLREPTSISTSSYDQAQSNSSTSQTQLYPDIDSSRRPSFVTPEDAFNPKQHVYREESEGLVDGVNNMSLNNDGSHRHLKNYTETNYGANQQTPKPGDQYGNQTVRDNNSCGDSSWGRNEETYNMDNSGNVDTNNERQGNMLNSNTSLTLSNTLSQNNPDPHVGEAANGVSEEYQHQQPLQEQYEQQQQQQQQQKQPHSSFQEVYVKIKVFHEDDLIAIRVSNAIPFDQLSEKIAERLGLSPERIVLLHKSDRNHEMVEIRNSEDFLKALGNKVKLVLCAR